MEAVCRVPKNEVADRFINKTCELFGISASNLFGKYRGQSISAIRHAVIYILRFEYGHNTVTLGRLFSRDHASICHSCQQAKKYKSINEPFFMNIYNKIQANG